MDVHKDLLVITRLVNDSKETRRFGVDVEALHDAMEWLRRGNCLSGVMESTGVYWVPIYSAFKEAGFNVSVANALPSQDRAWKEM